MTRITVLVVDGDDEARAATVAELEHAGLSVLEEPSVERGVERLENQSVDCVVTEYEFQESSGLELLSELRTVTPDTPCILFTDADPADIDTEAFEGLVVEYLQKDEDEDRERLRQRVDEITSLRTQVGYPLPDDEDARLAALEQYNIAEFDIQSMFDRSRVAAIECGGPQVETGDQNIKCVGSPSDLTGIGIEYSSLYEGLYGEGIERVRTGLFTVSTLLMYADEIQPVYRFLHTLNGRVRSADGFAACVVDPTAQDDQTFSSIMQTFDGRVDLREADGGGTEIRVRGLPDQPSDWQHL